MKEGYSLRPYQQEAVSAVLDEWDKGIKRTLLILPTGCHDPAQGVLMADGTIRRASEIEIGDLLMGDDGTPRQVLMLHHGKSMMYRVTPVKGNPFIVNGDHVLPLVRTNEKGSPKHPCQMLGGSIDTVKTKDWNSKTKWYRHIHKLFRSEQIDAFKNDSYSKITVDPYFLGVLLGDGEIKTCINITTPEREVADVIKQQADLYGMGIREMPAGKATTYFLKSGTLGRNGGKLHNELVALNVYKKGSREKSIPLHYKTAPIAVRLDVLAGLIDTDGSLTKNGYDFISASKQLSEDVAFIARSSGLAAYVSECIKSNQSGYTGTYWRVSISGNCDRIPLRVARKKADRRKQKKNALRTGIKKIEKIGEGEYFGFTVDGNNLYLLDDFTVTHNCGKTICFSRLTQMLTSRGERVLILAHRGELLQQAADKLRKSAGLESAIEKASEKAYDTTLPVVIGSIQTLQNKERRKKYDKNFFDAIIVDEAHHSLSDSYRNILDYFDAKVLGVTATPDRGDKRGLSEVYDSIAYEYTLPQAIREGYLARIRAQTIPIDIDMSSVSVSQGDYQLGDIGNALDPYLEQIATEMVVRCRSRKTVVFLPLIETSQKFAAILNSKGLKTCEVNGQSENRKEILQAFERGEYACICNSMLLTEGWDCPSVDCVVVLRPTKVRSLFCQMVGRGTRIYDGKESLLILDFLWHTAKHDLCKPSSLFGREVGPNVDAIIDEHPELNFDLLDEIERSEIDAKKQREEALAKAIRENRAKKRRNFDLLDYMDSLDQEDILSYEPTQLWEFGEATEKQLKAIEAAGIDIGTQELNKGQCAHIINVLHRRREEGLCTPRQLKNLKRYGYEGAEKFTLEEAKRIMGALAAVKWKAWKLPVELRPENYIREAEAKSAIEWEW